MRSHWETSGAENDCVLGGACLLGRPTSGKGLGSSWLPLPQSRVLAPPPPPSPHW